MSGIETIRAINAWSRSEQCKKLARATNGAVEDKCSKRPVRGKRKG